MLHNTIGYPRSCPQRVPGVILDETITLPPVFPPPKVKTKRPSSCRQSSQVRVYRYLRKLGGCGIENPAFTAELLILTGYVFDVFVGLSSGSITDHYPATSTVQRNDFGEQGLGF